MARDFKVFKRAFNAGEISQSAKWRNDLEKHAYACEALENFYVSALGGISRREGTRFLGVLGSVSRSDKVRLVPFEFNREFSFILALHTNNGNDSIDSFVFPKAFSILLQIPENFNDTGEILKKDSLVLSRYANGVFTLSTKNTSLNFQLNSDAHKLVIVYERNFFTVFADSDHALVHTQFGELGTEHSPMTTNSTQHLGLKLYTYDISSIPPEYHDYYYTIEHFLNDTNPQGVYTPEWENQTSLFGSKVGFNSATVVLTSDKTLYNEAEANFLAQNPDWNIEDAIDFFNVKNPVSIEELIRRWSVLVAEDSITGFERATYIQQCLAEACGYDNYDDFIVGQNKDFDWCNDFIYALSRNEFDIYSLIPGKPNFSDRISVPFYVPAGIRCCFNGELLTSETKFYLTDQNGNSVEITDGKEIVFDYNVQSFDIVLKSYKDIFIWNLFEVNLNNIFPNTKKTVLFDVYDIEGNVKQQNLRSPILETALEELQYKQVGGDIYFTHSSFLPQKLSVDSVGKFSWKQAITIQPSLNSPEDNLSFTFKGDAGGVLYKDDTVLIISNRNFFSNDMVGEQLKVDYVDKSQKNYRWKYNSTGAVSDVFPSYGSVKLRTESGIWDGTILLEESTDNGASWHEIGRVYSVQGGNNAEIARETFDIQSVVRARMLEQNRVQETESTTVDPNTEGCFFSISTNTTNMVWIEIVSVSSSRIARVRVLNPCRSNLTSKSVYKSSWSEKFGYPRAVDVHEERLTLAGNKNQPSTIWLSATNNWDNFRAISNLETDPLSYTLASDDGEPVSWLVSRQDLMIGMGSSEWSLGSRDAGQALSASIVQASNQSDDGVEYVMPTKAGGMVVFVRRGGIELASLTYDFANDGYNAVSLTSMHPELLKSGVVNIFNQLSPNNKIYTLLKDGTLAVFTYDKENNVAAWGRFLFGAGVVSAMALSSGRYRSIFLVVRRNGHLCLERLDPNEQGTNNWLDCVPISENVKVPDDLQTSVPYVSRMKTMPFFIEDSIKIYGLQFFMRSSMGGKFRLVGFSSDGEAKADQWQDFKFSEDEIFDENKEIRDFRYKAVSSCAPLEEGAVEILSDYPAPFNLNAIGAKVEKL